MVTELSTKHINLSYGTIEAEGDVHVDDDTSPIIHIDHDIVNHGHAYSDAIVDTVLIESDALRRRDENEEGSSGKDVSYWTIIRDNENFRWYLMSYLVTHAGEWFTYVASISAIEQIQASNNTISRTSISILISLRLLPNAFFTSIGGVLADSYDRKTILWVLDLIGSLVAFLFLLAYHMRSITALYIATALQMTVAAIYEPNRSAIVSMLVADEASLKKAMTLSGLAWSVMTAVGSSMGGFAAEWLGISTCFYIDSASYFISALLILNIKGRYLASDSESHAASCTRTCNNEEKPFFSLSQFTTMFIEGLKYLHSKPWGPFVFFKLCAALIFGAADVLNVSFSERAINNEMDAMEGSSQRLGMLFAFVGIGCFIGPVVIDYFTSMDQVASLERACCGSFILMGIGCFGLSRVESFLWICIYTSVRSAGSSVVWIYSSLLLQKFSSANMLGRVMSVDYALATLSEAFSAMCAGVLQDDFSLTAEQVAFLTSLVALATLILWVIYFAVVRV